ncbi:putative CheY-like receiver [Candidatus Terasakiella magnetica]|uniref:Putative CheY-like receiver n=1 Tax=Candidatus Terasakiella magnetica TaxID=1867952 RepID=A0A1C3RL85_9PROT|nr:response regulator [Candidatus Terasakiella magnetica]SCA58008.1 putative CheY-like receiver [Candidatus Terasakiella magnetica]
MKTTFVVADDHPLLLEGVKGVLRKIEPDADILQAISYPDLLEVLSQDLDFSLVIADLNMPGMKGLDGIRAVQSKRPEVPVIIISATESQKAINKTLECGVAGYMFKSFSQEQMLEAVETVLEGETFVPEANIEMFSGDEFADDKKTNFGAAALNQLPMGVVIVDKTAQVLFMNNNASDIFAQSDGVDVGPTGIFRTAKVGETKNLHAMISDAAIDLGDDEEREGGAMIVTRPSMKRSFSLLVVPLPDEDDVSSDDGNVAVFINDPEMHNEPPTNVLARLYGLTDAEARLLQALIVGKKLETVADEAGVSMNTVRSHLKQVFRKTGTNRQPELVSLVMNSSAYLASNPVSIEEDFDE